MRKTLLVTVVAAAATYGLVMAAGSRAESHLSCRASVVVASHAYYGTVYRSGHTSCPFARNVLRASLTYIVEAGGVGDGDFVVSGVWSPVTRKFYRVHCFAHGDLWTYGVRVDCRAGIGARVVYRATHS